MQWKTLGQKTNRVSESIIIVHDGKKYFVKRYEKGYPDSLIASEFEKAKKIYALLKKTDVKTPKPLSVDTKRREIVFEHIPGMEEFKSVFFRNNTLFSANRKKTKEVLARITKAIAYLHDNLKLKKMEIFTIPGIEKKNLVPVLADVCNSNILFKGDDIYLIDFAPTPGMYTVKTCNVMSYWYLDIVSLVCSYELPPLWQRMFMRKKAFGEYETAILTTYLNTRKKTAFRREEYKKAKEYYLRRYLGTVENTPITGKIWKSLIEKKLGELQK